LAKHFSILLLSLLLAKHLSSSYLFTINFVHFLLNVRTRMKKKTWNLGTAKHNHKISTHERAIIFITTGNSRLSGAD
jgi:hypothetical protein